MSHIFRTVKTDFYISHGLNRKSQRKVENILNYLKNTSQSLWMQLNRYLKKKIIISSIYIRTEVIYEKNNINFHLKKLGKRGEKN